MQTGYLILGCSAAGIAAAEAIRQVDKTTPLTMVSAENVPAYARCLLPELLSGRFSRPALSWREEAFYVLSKIELILDNPARRLHPGSKTVELADGTEIRYERLLLATGARSIPLPSGPGANFAVPLRTLAETERVGKEVEKEKEAVIIGAGPVGLKAAVALRNSGMRVTVVEQAAWIMPAFLEEESARILQDVLQKEGIEFITGQGVKSISIIEEHGQTPGRRKKVELAERKCLTAGVVLNTTGMLPNKELAAEAGIATGQGIVVDRYQQTSLPDVYAAGDVCQVKDELAGRAVIPGRWDTAVEQGRVAGYNMAGGKRVVNEYIAMHAGQYGPLPVVTLGLGNAKPDREYRIYTLAQPERGLYRRLVFQNGRLVGAIFLGDVSRAGVFAAFIRSGKEVAKEAPEMLKGRLPIVLPLAGRQVKN